VGAFLGRREAQREFIVETTALLHRAERPAGAATTIDEPIVAEHSSRLLEAATDQGAFQAALEALDADKALGTADWYAIANRYRNTPSGATHIYKFKSVKAARAAIRDVFIERFEGESRSTRPNFAMGFVTGL
jgi:hypothetical protein